MIVETTDPITGNDVKDLENAPFIVDGDLDIEVENPAENFEHNLDNPAPMGPGDNR